MASLSTVDDFLAFDPQTFTPEIAKGFLGIKFSDKLQQRVQVLGDKCNEGTITDEERAEYDRYIQFDELITLVQAKAKRVVPTEK